MNESRVIFVMPLYAGTEGKAGGVYNEIIFRKKIAENIGFKTEFFDPWQSLKAYDAEKDIFHVFMANNATVDFVIKVKSYGFKVVISPILDTQWKPSHVNLFVNSIKKIRILHSHLKSASIISELADAVCSRSSQESVMLEVGLGTRIEKIHKILNLPKKEIGSSGNYRKDKRNKILFVGNWGTERKNVPSLIKAMKHVDAELIIAGSPSNSPVKEEVLRLSEGVDNVFIQGFLSDEELVNYYEDVKVFAMPSLFEGTGLAALDALSYGTNVVITDKGGVKDYFMENSYFVNPHSIKSIADGLNKALGEEFRPVSERFLSMYKAEEIERLTKAMYRNVL